MNSLFMSLRAIVFDLDGVVIDSESIADASNIEFLKRRDLTYDRDGVKHLLCGQSLLDGTRMLMDFYGITGDVHVLMQERLTIRKRIYAQHVSFVDGFMDFLERVNQKGLKTCLATSSPSELVEVADAKLGLQKLFHGRVFTVADVGGISKSAPDLFLYAAKKLGVSPRECLVIEDSPLGIQAAMDAGMCVVGMTTTFPEEKLAHATKLVRKFSEINLDIENSSFFS